MKEEEENVGFSKLDTGILLVAIIRQFGKAGKLPISGIKETMEEMQKNGGKFRIETYALDGDTIVLDGFWGDNYVPLGLGPISKVVH